jgi:hypothetical protein
MVSGFIKTYGLFGGGGEAEAGEGGEGESGWEIAGKITEATGLAFDDTEASVIMAEKLANRMSGATNAIIDFGKVGKGASGTLAGLGVVTSVVQGINNPYGWQNHNTADVAIGTAEFITSMIIEATNPVGWAVLGAEGLYFLGNLWYESKHHGQSITEALFDK